MAKEDEAIVFKTWKTDRSPWGGRETLVMSPSIARTLNHGSASRHSVGGGGVAPKEHSAQEAGTAAQTALRWGRFSR